MSKKRRVQEQDVTACLLEDEVPSPPPSSASFVPSSSSTSFVPSSLYVHLLNIPGEHELRVRFPGEIDNDREAFEWLLTFKSQCTESDFQRRWRMLWFLQQAKYKRCGPSVGSVLDSLMAMGREFGYTKEDYVKVRGYGDIQNLQARVVEMLLSNPDFTPLWLHEWITRMDEDTEKRVSIEPSLARRRNVQIAEQFRPLIRENPNGVRVVLRKLHEIRYGILRSIRGDNVPHAVLYLVKREEHVILWGECEPLSTVTLFYEEEQRKRYGYQVPRVTSQIEVFEPTKKYETNDYTRSKFG